MKKLTTLFLGALLCTGVFTSCGGGSTPVSSTSGSEPVSATESSQAVVSSESSESIAQTGTTLADIQAKGKLVIGLDNTFAPMGFVDESGTLVGFDIDLATAVCEELGVTPVFEAIDWDAKEMELSTGRIDCIWNGMSITPEREEQMSLSAPYLNNKIIVMTNEGVTVASKEDLANYNIGVQVNSAALEALQSDELYDTYSANIAEYPTYNEVILDMQSGRVDCMVIDEVFGSYKNAQLETPFAVSTVDFGDDLYAIGFRKDDAELAQAVNNAIHTLKENGKAEEISTVWFGSDITLDTVA